MIRHLICKASVHVTRSFVENLLQLLALGACGFAICDREEGLVIFLKILCIFNSLCIETSLLCSCHNFRVVVLWMLLIMRYGVKKRLDSWHWDGGCLLVLTRIERESQRSRRRDADAVVWEVRVPANGRAEVTAVFGTNY